MNERANIPPTQRCVGDDGKVRLHREQPSRRLARATVSGPITAIGQHWENDIYYGTLRRYPEGFPLGGGPYAVIGISSLDESARHDWRDFQRIKNDLVGEEWEAVELYPAESRLLDPSNRFYLWCAPRGVFTFGLFSGRNVKGITNNELAPQRPFPEEAE